MFHDCHRDKNFGTISRREKLVSCYILHEIYLGAIHREREKLYQMKCVAGNFRSMKYIKRLKKSCDTQGERKIQVHVRCHGKKQISMICKVKENFD
jgi:hypothetical protein